MTNWSIILKFQVLSLLLLTTSIASSVAVAGQTDAEIRNYSQEDIAIEYRLVTLGGKVTWKTIGTIPKRSAKVFRNITIGSVIRAKGDNVTQQFTVNSPTGGKNQVVLRVNGSD